MEGCIQSIVSVSFNLRDQEKISAFFIKLIDRIASVPNQKRGKSKLHALVQLTNLATDNRTKFYGLQGTISLMKIELFFNSLSD